MLEYEETKEDGEEDDEYETIDTLHSRFIVDKQEAALRFDIEHHNTRSLENNNMVLSAFQQLHDGCNIYFLNSKFGRSVKTNSVKIIYYIKVIKPGK